MCGRFSLGVDREQVRLGIASHFVRRPRSRDNTIRSNDTTEGHQRRRGRGGGRGAQNGAASQPRRRTSRQARIHHQEGDEENPGSPDWPDADADADADADEEEEEEVGNGDDHDEEEAESSRSVGRLRGGGEVKVEEHDQDYLSDLVSAANNLCWPTESLFREKNFNVAPRSNSVILRLKKGKSRKEADNFVDLEDLQVDTMQWGLIPHWSKHPPTGPLNTINARSENLIDSSSGGMWQSLKGHKRCLVPVEGYYEWQKKGATKVPHFTRLPSFSEENPDHPLAQPISSSALKEIQVPRLMFLAGLFDTVKYVDSAPDDPPLATFTILTTTPSKSLEFLHDRMPVILEDPAECALWLDNEIGWSDKVGNLLHPYHGEVKCYPVQPEVGKIGNNSSSFILPVAERKDGVASFFKKQAAASSHKNEQAKSPTKAESAQLSVHRPVERKTRGGEGNIRKPEAKEAGLDIAIGDDSNAPNTTSKSKDVKPIVKAEKRDREVVEVLSSDEEQPQRSAKKPKLNSNSPNAHPPKQEQLSPKAKYGHHLKNASPTQATKPNQKSLDSYFK